MLVATVVSAAVLGIGIPLGWLWIGSQVQGDSGVSELNFSVAMLILFGIIASYVIALYIAGWVMARVDPRAEGRTQGASTRTPWMRGMTDTRAKATRSPIAGEIERIFVITTMIAGAAFWLWLLFLAGSPLPSQ